ncbi:DUF805 domain-containing protein [Roseibium litorale]|uniref:DUF805 domain-containing protein n=1 Tax=Roseibium litorale TaxID=2803841 RepID=A0ABR9CQ15_9HYPH|nr:DUF805 domain-containing protein [Roseibium litorale]
MYDAYLEPRRSEDFEAEPHAVVNAATSLFNVFFSFEGRIGRLNYWLATTVCGVTIWAILSLLGIDTYTSSASRIQPETPVLSPAGYYLLVTTAVIAGLIRASFEIRRFHDRDKSGL